MATKETVKRCLAVLAGSKPGTDMTAVNLESYALALEPVPDQVMEQVTMMGMRVPGAFIPDAGTLFGIALDLLDPEPDAGTAWALVEKYLTHLSAPPGSPSRVELPDRAARALAAMGGQPGHWQKADLPFRRREFEKLYEAQGQRWREGVSAGRLALPAVDERRMLE